MNRRNRWLLPLLFLVAASFLLPAMHWRAIGWVRGEAFYQGRPTSWWKVALLDGYGAFILVPSVDEERQGLMEAEEGVYAPWPPESGQTSQTQLWAAELSAYLALPSSDGPPLRDQLDSIAAAPVLCQLLQDQDPRIVWQAARRLRFLAPRVPEAIPILQTQVKNAEPRVRWEVNHALAAFR